VFANDEEISECKIYANERRCYIDRFGDLRCFPLTKSYRGCRLQNGTEIQAGSWNEVCTGENPNCKSEATCLFWWCDDDGIYGFCNVYSNEIDSSYNIARCKIKKDECKRESLVLAEDDTEPC